MELNILRSMLVSVLDSVHELLWILNQYQLHSFCYVTVCERLRMQKNLLDYRVVVEIETT